MVPSNTGTAASTTTKEGTSEESSKTYQTPKAGDDSVPSLCSTNSTVGIVSLPSECEKDQKEDTPEGGQSDVKAKLEAFEGDADVSNDGNRPSSISCASSVMEITSPLASKPSPRKETLSFDDVDSKSYVRSPVPSTATERVSSTVAWKDVHIFRF